MLTPRQLECLSWVREGKSSTDIGAQTSTTDPDAGRVRAARRYEPHVQTH